MPNVDSQHELQSGDESPVKVGSAAPIRDSMLMLALGSITAALALFATTPLMTAMSHMIDSSKTGLGGVGLACLSIATPLLPSVGLGASVYLTTQLRQSASQSTTRWIAVAIGGVIAALLAIHYFPVLGATTRWKGLRQSPIGWAVSYWIAGVIIIVFVDDKLRDIGNRPGK